MNSAGLKSLSVSKNSLPANSDSPFLLSPSLYHAGFDAYAFLPKLYGGSAIINWACGMPYTLKFWKWSLYNSNFFHIVQSLISSIQMIINTISSAGAISRVNTHCNAVNNPRRICSHALKNCSLFIIVKVFCVITHVHPSTSAIGLSFRRFGGTRTIPLQHLLQNQRCHIYLSNGRTHSPPTTFPTV